MHAQERLVYVTPETLKKQVELVLSAWGMMSEKVELIADLLVETDLRGIESHGASMLPLYDKMRRAGGLNMMPKSRIVRENAAMALIDGDAGLGHPVAVEAMNLAIRKCKEIGVGAVSVMNSHHFGATGLYAEMAARGRVRSSHRLRDRGGDPDRRHDAGLGTNNRLRCAVGQGPSIPFGHVHLRRRCQQGKSLRVSRDPTTGGVGGRRSRQTGLRPERSLSDVHGKRRRWLDADGRHARDRHPQGIWSCRDGTTARQYAGGRLVLAIPQP
jgi:hypothetical protein